MISFPFASPRSPPGAPAAGKSAARNLEAAYDAELVRRFNAGDDAAFAEIVTRYRGRMLAVGLSFLRNHADAEEIAQDTFIRAYRGLGRFRGESSLVTWLQCIAFNLSRNRYWYFHRRHRHHTCSFDSSFSDENPTTLADLVASPAPDPARSATTDEFVQQVAVCMENLSSNHREILTLRTVMNHSYEEIAATLGITVGTVKSRIARARTTLRELLTEKYDDTVSDALLSFPRFEGN